MEQTNNAAPAAPSNLKTLSILSYIGSGFWALISILFIVASGWIMGMLGMGMSRASETMEAMEGMEGVDAAEMAAAQSAVGGAMAMGTGLLIGVGVFLLLLQVLSIWGVVKMNKLQKGGFWMYAIGNGIFGILCILGMTLFGIVTGLVCILFIVLFGMNLKYMR